MFPFDQASLPQLTTRKALIIVDLQNGFLSKDGPLPVTEPEGFVERTLALAEAFRPSGVVVWARTKFKVTRSADPEQVILDDSPPSTPTSVQSTRSRGRRSDPSGSLHAFEDLSPEDAEPPLDPEAFLSHAESFYVDKSPDDCRMPPVVEKAIQKRDVQVIKSHYSAFQETQLLMMLRSKLVTEVFICGSLANVGVHATALEAAGHGMAITIVEDCCGYRNEARQRRAVKNLVEVTGCEIASQAEVLESMGHVPSEAATASMRPRAESNTISTAPRIPGRSSQTPDLAKPLAGLRLASLSATPAPHDLTELVTQKDGDEVEVDTNEEVISTELPRPPPKSSTADRKNGTLSESEALEVKEPASDEPRHESRRSTMSSPLTVQLPPQETTSGTAEGNASVGADEGVVEPKEDPESTSEDEEALKGICEGDTDVIRDVLPTSMADSVFNKLREEIEWKRMFHQGGEVPRLVAVQGEVAEDGSMPVYRHPSDESPPLLPFSPTVLKIKAEIENRLGHPLNHVLIQFYRDGMDYISEHSDKTLDIVPTSFIANVSLGAERTMVLRTKRKDKEPSQTRTSGADDLTRKIQRARLPHNSLCRMGLNTNMKWLHAIRQDKRAARDKTAAELAYKSGRISLTFRQIGTFLNQDETLIWGQGATSKTQKAAKSVVNGQTPEAVNMLRAFGTENHSSTFDWDAHYGQGFDVLHIRAAPRLFTSGDKIVNNRIGLMLAETGISWANGRMGSLVDEDSEAQGASEALHIRFIDNDDERSTISGELAIMLYLDWWRSQKNETPSPTRTSIAQRYQLFQQGLTLREHWHRTNAFTDKDRSLGLKSFILKNLKPFEACLFDGEDDFLAGSEPSLPDFAVWPVVHEVIEEHGVELLSQSPALQAYYARMKARGGTQNLLNRIARRIE